MVLKMTEFTKEYKFKIILELLKGDSTIAELVSKYKASKTTIHRWKVEFLAKGASIFGSKTDHQQDEEQLSNLHKIIGQLKVENDFLQQSLKKLK